ncbi:exosortase F-associated protein [Nonlabens sp. Hel1_33_55]|uniref:exosortase F system-associated membrane protein n=1 Tax=Nonlabens sp. Hel1_33_55 TaxID=1336802 RepID=UPI000875EB52|nr:exosortase F system-associated protein [Nonlabens sp. Hel1_33_55]SCY25179.1 exosortase F-associated protein [Nonlabens sp. Hel1_33_55]
MSRLLQICAVAILLVLLVCVRYFQHDLFYDPLDEYFHGAFQSMPFPEMKTMWLFLSNSLRYSMNAIISLAIIWVLFKSASYIKAGLWVYLFAFIVLNVLFFVTLQFEASLSKMALFYTRRFLIHPLLLFVLVAGGYFLKTRNAALIADSNAPDDKK